MNWLCIDLTIGWLCDRIWACTK